MAETQTPHGTLVRHPDAVSIVPSRLDVGDAAATLRRRSASQDTARDRPDELEIIVAAAEAQEMAVADAFEIAPPAGLDRRRRTADTRGSVEVEVSLAAGEEAVLLLESEGVYAWQRPEPAPVVARRRRTATPRLRFRVPLYEAEPPAGPQRRSWITDRLVGAIVEPIRAVVLKFVAGKVIDIATGRLDERVSPRQV
jgi:hypothetical protein